MEDEYDDIRKESKGQGKNKKQHERMKISCQISWRSRANILTQKRDFFYLKIIWCSCIWSALATLKEGKNLSKGDISTSHIKEEDGAIAVMHPYLS